MIEQPEYSVPHPLLRIIDHPPSDQIWGLAGLCHMHDYVSERFQPKHRDFDVLNSTYKGLWLSVGDDFYNQRPWVQLVKENFKGIFCNFSVNPQTIDNTLHDFDIRVGYVKGRPFFLMGDPKKYDLAGLMVFAEKACLDIGVINLYRNEMFVSTVWDINASKTEKEAKESKKFIEAIFRHFGTSPYWNGVREEQITKVSYFYLRKFYYDYTYDDVSSDSLKSLIVFDKEGETSQQFRSLIRSKNLSSVEVYVGEEPESKNITKYDCLALFVDEEFILRNSLFFHKVKRDFTGKLINFSCLPFLFRDAIFDTWLEDKSIYCPRYVRVLGDNLPDKKDIPFSPPYIIRGAWGQNGLSKLRKVDSYSNLSSSWEWETWKQFGNRYADFIIQEFIDVSIDGTWDSGRIFWVGDTIIPMYALRMSQWDARPLQHKIVLRTLDFEDFGNVIRGFSDIQDFEEDIKHIIKKTKIDVGALDFSIKNGKIIPWDAQIRCGHGLINHWMKRSSEKIGEIFNSFLRVMGNKVTITAEEAQEMLEESAWKGRYDYK